MTFVCYRISECILRSVCSRWQISARSAVLATCGTHPCLFSCPLTATSPQTGQQGINSGALLWSLRVPPLNCSPFPPNFSLFDSLARLSFITWMCKTISCIRPSWLSGFFLTYRCVPVQVSVFAPLGVSLGLYWCWQAALASLKVLLCTCV